MPAYLLPVVATLTAALVPSSSAAGGGLAFGPLQRIGSGPRHERVLTAAGVAAMGAHETAG